MKVGGIFTSCLIALLLTTLASSSSADQPAGKPLKVFILAGQSNMQGHAKIATFDYIGDDPATLPMLNEMVGTDGAPRTVKDTWISYLTQGRGTPNGEGFGKLSSGYGARTDPTSASDKIGPELTFGIYMQKSLKEPILIIKTAWGGKSLHTDFRPPSAGRYELSDAEVASIVKRGGDLDEERAKRAAQSGVYYRLMMDHVKSVLKDIQRVYPDYDAKQGYEVAGFVWFQGWNDVVNSRVYPRRGQDGGYDKYSEWMAAFIRDVRKDLKSPAMPFVIGVLGVNGPIDNVSERYRSIHGTFREAMAAPASLPEFKGNVIAVRTAPFWDMPLDRIQKKREEVNQQKRRLQSQVKNGELTEEEAATQLAKVQAGLVSAEDEALWKRGASNAGYHYYGCAKTMAQIGRAFAEAVLEMQSNASKQD